MTASVKVSGGQDQSLEFLCSVDDTILSKHHYTLNYKWEGTHGCMWDLTLARQALYH